MLLLDISDSGSQCAEGDQLISEFLGSKAVPDNPYSGSDLLSGFMIESLNSDPLNSAHAQPQNSATHDLMSIFQEHDDAMREANNNPSGQSC